MIMSQLELTSPGMLTRSAPTPPGTLTRSAPEDPIFGPVIFEYSRAQAITDGVLVDITSDETRRLFKWPIAVTRTVFEQYLNPSERCAARYGDTATLVWDMLYPLAMRVKAGVGGEQIVYRVKIGRRVAVLKSVAGPGDDAQPVISIMLPAED